MVDSPSPISLEARRGADPRELATTAAASAIRRRRSRISLGLAWRVAWRLLAVLAALVVMEVDLLVQDVQRDGFDDYVGSIELDERVQLALTGWTLLAVLMTAGTQLLRVVRARAVQVPPARTYRGIPGPSAVIVATWWVAPTMALALESRSNNDGWGTNLVVDAVSVALLALGALATRAASSVHLGETKLTWRGPRGTFVEGAIPETDVVPIAWENALIRFSFRLIGFVVLIMAATVAGSLGLLAVALAWAAFQVRSARRREEHEWPWRKVRLVALEGGVPGIVAIDDGVLDLANVVSATSRNESMVWTIAELTRRAGGTDDVETVDDQLRQVARDAAHAERPSATGPLTLRPTSAHAVRGRFASKGSIILGVAITALIGISALAGSLQSALMFGAIVLTLAVAFAVIGLRASRLELEVTATELVVRSVRGTQRIPLESVGAIVGVPVMQQPGPGELRVDVDGVVVDRSGALLTRLRGGDWSPDQIDELGRAMGVPTAAVQDVLPITTLAHAFPGYAPTWEREPGKFGVVLAIVIIAIVTLGVIGTEWDEITDADDRGGAISEQLRDERAFRDDMDDLVMETFPMTEREGGRVAGCVNTDESSMLLDDCPITIPVRTAVLAVAGDDPDAAVQALCRCRPSEFGFVRASDLRDPTAEPGSMEEFSPSPDAPQLQVEATLIHEDGPVKLLLDVRRDELGDHRVAEVRCKRGPTQPLTAARAGTTPASLRCQPEPDRDER